MKPLIDRLICTIEDFISNKPMIKTTLININWEEFCSELLKKKTLTNAKFLLLHLREYTLRLVLVITHEQFDIRKQPISCSQSLLLSWKTLETGRCPFKAVHHLFLC